MIVVGHYDLIVSDSSLSYAASGVIPWIMFFPKGQRTHTFLTVFSYILNFHIYGFSLQSFHLVSSYMVYLGFTEAITGACRSCF
jgi:hypothetical protein